MLKKSDILDSGTVRDVKNLFERDLCKSMKCPTDIGDLDEVDYKNGLVGVKNYYHINKNN